MLAPDVAPRAQVRKVKVLLSGDDRSVMTVQGLEPIEIPTGRYQIENVEIIVQDPKTKLDSSFVFSSSGRLEDPANPRFFEVTPGGLLKIDPIGELLFRLCSESDYQRGKHLRVTPRLFTQDGLNLTSSYVGVDASGTSGRESSVQTRALDAQGKNDLRERVLFLVRFIMHGLRGSTNRSTWLRHGHIDL